MSIIVATFVVFGLVVAAMAVGVLFHRRAIRGSCGGLGVLSARLGLPLCACGGNPEACQQQREEDPGGLGAEERAGMGDKGSVGGKFLRAYQQAAPYTTLGLQYGITILVCLFVGWWVDGKAGTEPLFLIVGTFLGAVAGFYNLYRAVVRGEDEQQRKAP
ncbi:MAG: AtpZ/AtpI family protein [Candidatus Latescibacterota bacterium]